MKSRICPICNGRKTTSHRGDPRSIKACSECAGQGTVSEVRYCAIAAAVGRAQGAP